tara:strand:- start:20 stop:142 length:123 start_codon:yes stop_codon:yes gene_type:complete
VGLIVHNYNQAMIFTAPLPETFLGLWERKALAFKALKNQE